MLAILLWHIFENHRSELLNKLSGEQLYSLFSRVPLYKIGNKDHDRIIELRDKVMQISQAPEKGKDIGEIVQKEVNRLIEQAPEEQKKIYF